MHCSLQNHKSINEMYQTDPIVYSCRHLQPFWCITKKEKKPALFTIFFIDINEQLKLNYWDVLSSYCSLTHPYVPERRPFLLRPKIPQRNNWWGMNHFISLKASRLFLYSCIFWSFVTSNDIHMVPARIIRIMRYRNSLKQPNKLF